MSEIRLPGCTPEPLINYLKALGVLRTIVEQQVDPDAHAYWRRDVFYLVCTANQETLLDFFRHHYAPSPIIAPWGARSGFYGGSSEKSAREALDSISKQKDPRFQCFNEAVGQVRQLLKNCGISAKAKDEEKLALLAECRSRLSDDQKLES
jgi:CRISPR-associated protein Csx17